MKIIDTIELKDGVKLFHCDTCVQLNTGNDQVDLNIDNLPQLITTLANIWYSRTNGGTEDAGNNNDNQTRKQSKKNHSRNKHK